MAKRVQVIRDLWDVRFLELDLCLSVGLTLTFAGWLWLFDGGEANLDSFLGPQKEVLYRTTATVSGTMVGFTMTVAALVFNRVASERFHLFRSANLGQNYDNLCKTYTQAVKFLGVLTVVSIAALLIDTQTSPCHWIMVGALLFALLSFFRVARAIWILEKLLKVPV